MAKEKILLLALPGIGDALLATPMISLLRRARPEAEIHALVMFGATRDLFSSEACIDRVHYFDFVNGSKLEALQFVLKLRGLRFDISINIYPQNRREYNLISRLIGAKRRLGLRYRRRDAQNLNWLNSETIIEDDTLHCVEENVKLLTLLGVTVPHGEMSLPSLRLQLSARHEAFAENWFRNSILSSGDCLIGIHAGTALFKNHVRRRWSPYKFAKLAKRMTEELGAKVLLFGGPDDKEANEIIISQAGDAVIPVETKSILDSVAVMKRVSLFVSNDSALMHIAGALQLPTVAIFGPTNETYVHPWKTRYEIVQTGLECRPCFIYSPKPLTCYRTNPNEQFLCIEAIEVQTVMNSVQNLLGRTPTLPILKQ